MTYNSLAWAISLVSKSSETSALSYSGIYILLS